MISKSHTYIGKLVAKGVIVLVNNKIDVESAKKAIEEHKDPTRDAQREANEKRRAEPDLMSLAGSYPSQADMTVEEKEELKKIKEEVEKEKKAALDEGINLDDEDDEAFAKITGAVARAEKEYWLGQKAKIEYKRLKGEYMLVKDSEKQAFEAGRAVRDALLSLPPRLSPIFAGESNRFNIERLFLEEINQVLSGLCNEHK